MYYRNYKINTSQEVALVPGFSFPSMGTGQLSTAKEGKEKPG